MKKTDEIDVHKRHTVSDGKKKPTIFFETVTGLLFYAISFAILAAIYVAVFGYLGGHLLFYAFSDTLAIPITFSTCFTIGLIPVLNLLGFLIAFYVLMWKLLLFLGLKLLLWLLDVLPPFLRKWSNNLR